MTTQERTEAVDEMIVRRVKVNRSRSPQETLDATGRSQYVDSEVVATMPRGEGEEVDVYFFPNKRQLSNAELEGLFNLLRLKPDPYALAAVNEADPAFADNCPNSTPWRDAGGNWCCIAFDRWACSGERDVRVERRDIDYIADWLFGGVPK